MKTASGAIAANAAHCSCCSPEVENRRYRIGVTLRDMWPIKDYILSGALYALTKDYEVFAWVPSKFLDGARELARNAGCANVQFRSAPAYKPSSVLNTICRLQRIILFERHNVPTERILRLRQSSNSIRGRSRAQQFLAVPFAIIAKLPLGKTVDWLLERLRKRFTPRMLYNQEFESLQLDAVFITDPIGREDDPVYYEALRRGLPIATLVLSWDNLTNKGKIHSAYTRLLVWNELMRQEVTELYPAIGGSRVRIVGFPRFDVYLRSLPPEFERWPFLESLGLDPGGRVLLFANSATKTFGVQPQVIEHICQALEDGSLPGDVQLLVRCHPHDDMKVYQRFRLRKRVVLWPETARGREKSLYEQIPDANDLLILCASLRHAAVCVNPGSTIMLDAAAADVPILCVAYDGDEDLPFWQSYRTSYEFSHQKAFHKTGATVVCYSRAELIRAIQMALDNPKDRQAQRKAAFEQFLGGKASSIERLRYALREMIHVPFSRP